MPANNLTVVQLMDAGGNVVGYAAGPASETSVLAATTWTPRTGTSVQSEQECLKEVMRALVKKYREMCERDGVLIDGNLFETDAESQTRYLSSLLFATRDPQYTGSWYTRNNGYVLLDANGMYTLGSGIMTYIQNCVARERALLMQIDSAGTVEQLQAIEIESGWPQGSTGLPLPELGTEAPALDSAGVMAATATISGAIACGTVTVTGDASVGGTLTASLTGTATNVTATSNSTLTTLTSLSLPGSQVTDNIAGSSSNVTGTIAITNGGTGATTAAGGITALTGTQSAGTYLRSNGTTSVLSAIQAADVPTLNQNTTGTAANMTAASNSTLTSLTALSLPGTQVTGNIAGSAGNVTGTVALSSGGTGATTASGGITALTGTQIEGTYLRSNGTAAALSAIQAADVPTLNQNTTGTASNVTAVSNSTLTSLTALSLPGTQVSGNISGSAGNVTDSSNSTLTSLTALSLPGTQVTGNISGSSGNVTGTIAIANGGTGSTTAAGGVTALTGTQIAGTYLRSNGTTAALTAIQAADVPILNQNTTGSASNVTATSNATLTSLTALSLPGTQVTGNIAGSAGNVTGTVAIASGGTGATTAAGGITALTGTQIAGTYLRSNGATASLSAIQAADVPTLNQHTTGTALNVTAASNATLTTLTALSLPGTQVTGNIAGSAGNVTGTIAIANGGTGATTAASGITALTGTQITGRYLRSNGTTAALSAIQAADVPTLNQNTSGTATNVTGAVNSTLTTLSALSLPINQVSGLATADVSVATVSTTGIATFGGALSVTGSATVTGVTTISPSLDVNGAFTADSGAVTGLLTVGVHRSLNSLSCSASLDGVLTTSNSTPVRAGTILWRLGDTPPTGMYVVLTNSTNASTVVTVRAVQQTPIVTYGTVNTTRAANTPYIVFVPFTGTQFTANSNTHYAIDCQFLRVSGNATVTMSALTYTWA